MNPSLVAIRVGYPMFAALVRCFELLVLFALLVLMEVSRVGNGWGFTLVLGMAIMFYVVNEYWLPLITS